MKQSKLVVGIFTGLVLLARAGMLAQTVAPTAPLAAPVSSGANSPTQTNPPIQLAPSPQASTLAQQIKPTASELRLKTDWPWLARFAEENKKMAQPITGEERVVFMGDSITEGWHLEGLSGAFPGKPYINRGISGQTSSQMVLRFRQDVIELKPKVVVILAGINDIAGNTGLMTLEQIEDNLKDMAELAHANGIRVVLCSVLPAFDFPWKPGLTPAPKIVALNAWIRGYATAQGHIYVDYHTAMKDSRDGLPANLSTDGVHPIAAGYAAMGPLVEAGIASALTK